MEGYAFTDIIWYVVVGLILLIFIWAWVSSYLRKRKAKKLKYEWTWIVKKTKVSDAGERYVSWDEDSSWYYLYRLESKDDNWNVYKSDEFKDVLKACEIALVLLILFSATILACGSHLSFLTQGSTFAAGSKGEVIDKCLYNWYIFLSSWFP